MSVTCFENSADQPATSPLTRSIGGIDFPSVLLNASGAFNAPMFDRLFPLNETLGGIVTKTVTRNPQVGNRQPRTVELPGIGMLNSIGLQNPGLAYSLDADLPALAAFQLPLLLSISAHSSGEFAEMAETVLAHPSAGLVQALELNLSCPNVEKGGVHFGSAPDSVRDALKAVTAVWKKPIFAKLTPNVTDIVAVGEAALEGGALGLTAINTVLGVAIDVKTRKPIMPRVSAGYSGPGIKPVALHAIWNLHRRFPKVPIIGVGGIASTQDALEFLMAGASLIQLGTSCFRQPMAFQDVAQGLKVFCENENIKNIAELTGCAHSC
jgi:dihydroorotate dehydrogenase (NAD+) catalytic subunit